MMVLSLPNSRLNKPLEGGYGMASSYLEHKANECHRLLQILRETIQRNYSLREAVDSKLDELEMELTLLAVQLKETK